MDPETLRALESKAAIVPGGRDLEDRPVVYIPVPNEPKPMTKENINASLKYISSVFRYVTYYGTHSII